MTDKMTPAEALAAMDIVAADLSKDGCQFTAEQIRNARATLAAQLQSQAAEVERLRDLEALITNCHFRNIPGLKQTGRGLESEQFTVALIDGQPVVRMVGLLIDGDPARAEAAEADARRYRWMRNGEHFEAVSLVGMYAGEQLDAAIDALLAAGGE
jgi:hypothetical protein